MSKEKIEQLVLKSGLWGSERKSTHGFVLSPSVYEISDSQRQEFESIGAALHDCLAGLGRIVAIAYNPQLNHSATWGMIARIVRTGVPSIYHDIQHLKPSGVPGICKVDFMKAIDGHFYIAEIDGHNKHGLGYSTLAAQIRKIIMPKARAFPGVALALAKEVKRRNGGKNNNLVLLYADQERFYLPEFLILQEELAKHDVNLIIIRESDFNLSIKNEQYRFFVDLPFLYHNNKLNEILTQRYKKGEIEFIIHPKPFLGSKAILALLRNDKNDEEVEAILRSQIPALSLDRIRQHIPETYLINKRMKASHWEGLCQNKKFVIKESISSGMKGTVFNDDDNFKTIFEKACNSYYRFVLQKEVVNYPQEFQYFSTNGEILQDKWYMRITVHYTIRYVADIIVTARKDKKVHGALDCLQIGSVIVQK